MLVMSYIMHATSSKAYKRLCQEQIIILPSVKTLRKITMNLDQRTGLDDLITLVNTQFGASSLKTVLGYIWGADSKNDIGFFASALVFELRHTPIILTFICYTWILSNKEFV